MIEIQQARREQADVIARLIMMAMTDECCQNFCGEGRGLDDFLRMMTLLVERDDSQYSYRNTLVAVEDDRVVGIAVSYDGAQLHQLRLAFFTMAKEFLNRDHSGMDDETQAGELYLVCRSARISQAGYRHSSAFGYFREGRNNEHTAGGIARRQRKSYCRATLSGCRFPI